MEAQSMNAIEQARQYLEDHGKTLWSDADIRPMVEGLLREIKSLKDWQSKPIEERTIPGLSYMTTSQTSFLSEIISGDPIPANKLGYFRARLTNRLHELIITEFERLSQSGKISKADLARRIGKKPEQITRWLGAPGNWTIETVSDLAIGMGCEPKINLLSFLEQQASQPSLESLPEKVRELNYIDDSLRYEADSLNVRMADTRSEGPSLLQRIKNWWRNR
jgi:hypothetical protein